ncbi:unnamed protein product [Polarella glacialis]|uniref:Methyltransferase domain-containing protein n=1 Tax=Polarella glacialis TaxID=89957 RepID=A0A813K4X3_POLGL|nr:unnamed protein product [Polarella glacialis]
MPRGGLVQAACRVGALRVQPAIEAAAELTVTTAPRGRGPVKAWQPFGRALLHHMDRLEAKGTPLLAASSHVAPAEDLLYWSNLRPRRPEELPSDLFFRAPASMPALERHALELCRRKGGRTLDIGAGAGSHVLALTGLGLEAEGVDVCPEAVEVMHRRGVKAQKASIWELKDLRKYSTLLLMMNSIGIVGRMETLHTLLQQLHGAVEPDCQLLLDVSPPDWSAVRAAATRGKDPISSAAFQEGQWVSLNCWLSLGGTTGRSFPMLFAEPRAVAQVAQAANWRASVAFEDPESRHALLRLVPQTMRK